MEWEGLGFPLVEDLNCGGYGIAAALMGNGYGCDYAAGDCGGCAGWVGDCVGIVRDKADCGIDVVGASVGDCD